MKVSGRREPFEGFVPFGSHLVKNGLVFSGVL